MRMLVGADEEEQGAEEQDENGVGGEERVRSRRARGAADKEEEGSRGAEGGDRARARVTRETKGRKAAGCEKTEGEHGGREAKRGDGGQAGEKREGRAK